MAARPQEEDLYAVLGVPATASAADITAAYRALARQVHPDVAPESGRRMAQANHAYWVLRDPRRRRQYDAAHGRDTPPPSSPPPSPSPTPAVEDERPWAATDLHAYYEHWRQMFEEERRLWERLVQTRGPDHPEYPDLRHELNRTIHAQRALENDWRALHHLPALSASQWEAERAQELKVAARPASGCLAALAALAARLVLGLSIHLLSHRV